MTLPRLPRRAGRRLAGAAVLVWLAVACGGLPTRAEDASAFAATVPVDATADTVVKAREQARIDGQRRALAAVVDRLAGGGKAKLPKLSDAAITDLVASFEVANERMSAVRYLADYTFHFRPDAVRRAMASAGINLAEQRGAPPTPGAPPQSAPAEAGKAVVMLPVLQAGGQSTLWEDPNPWRDAWDRQSLSGGPVHLVVPLGDAGDIAAIDAGKARAGDPQALTAVAKRNAGDAVAVAVAELRGPPNVPTGVDVTVRDYRTGQSAGSHVDQIAANPGETEDALLRRAAAAILSDIEGGWKKAQLANYDQQGSLTAVLPIASLDDWLRARGRIAAVPAVRSIALVALSRQEATISIDYVGSIDQLKQGLAGISLDLVQGGSQWRLARGGPGSAGAPPQ